MSDNNNPSNTNPPSVDAPILFDMERMEKALNGPTFTVPPGLSREQIRQYIIDTAKRHGK